MDVNVKNLEPAIGARLAEQAAAEGVSQQEWLRQILRRSAARLSPAELMAERAASTPMSEKEFAALRKRVAAHRMSSAERLGATGRRR
ncbi:MAG: FitA-like ribbon-helix-helix domain-containing protein [Acidimicrobiales bacterium]